MSGPSLADDVANEARVEHNEAVRVHSGADVEAGNGDGYAARYVPLSVCATRLLTLCIHDSSSNPLEHTHNFEAGVDSLGAVQRT